MRFSMLLVPLVVLATTVSAYAEPPAAAKASPLTPTAKLTKEQLLKPLPTDVILGKKDAPVTIIEYSSLSCPHCAEFSNKTLPELEKKYIDTGKVRFISRDFPLNEPAVKAAMLAHCAGPDRYYQFLTVLFNTQDNWSVSKDYQESLENIAKLGGMSGKSFNECMDNETVMNSVLQIRLEAQENLKIQATPTFFINGEQHDGARDIEYFSKAIDKLLK